MGFLGVADTPMSFLPSAHRLGHRDSMVTATIYAHVTDEQIETASETFAHAMSGN
jgi:hypothetical protein